MYVTSRMTDVIRQPTLLTSPRRRIILYKFMFTTHITRNALAIKIIFLYPGSVLHLSSVMLFCIFKHPFSLSCPIAFGGSFFMFFFVFLAANVLQRVRFIWCYTFFFAMFNLFILNFVFQFFNLRFSICQKLNPNLNGFFFSQTHYSWIY